MKTFTNVPSTPVLKHDLELLSAHVIYSSGRTLPAALLTLCFSFLSRTDGDAVVKGHYTFWRVRKRE
jgi:hypothetical protein